MQTHFLSNSFGMTKIGHVMYCIRRLCDGKQVVLKKIDCGFVISPPLTNSPLIRKYLRIKHDVFQRISQLKSQIHLHIIIIPFLLVKHIGNKNLKKSYFECRASLLLPLEFQVWEWRVEVLLNNVLNLICTVDPQLDFAAYNFTLKT